MLTALSRLAPTLAQNLFHSRINIQRHALRQPCTQFGPGGGIVVQHNRVTSKVEEIDRDCLPCA